MRNNFQLSRYLKAGLVQFYDTSVGKKHSENFPFLPSSLQRRSLIKKKLPGFHSTNKPPKRGTARCVEWEN